MTEQDGPTTATDRRPLRVAAIQMKFVPSHRPIGAGRYLLPQEPLIHLGALGADGELGELLQSNKYDALRKAMRASARDIMDINEKLRQDNLDKKLRRVLRYCQERQVDIAVLPECSVPSGLVQTLK